MLGSLVCLSHYIIIASSGRYDLSHLTGKVTKVHKNEEMY